jgi:acyl dehydratase
MRFLEGTVLAFRSIEEWKFSAPVYIGDTIVCEVKVAELKEARRLGGGMVTFEVKVFNQQQNIVQKGAWTILIASQPE